METLIKINTKTKFTNKAVLTKRIKKETEALNYFISIIDLPKNSIDNRNRIISIIEQHRKNIEMLNEQKLQTKLKI